MIQLELRMPNGKYKKFMQDMVPYRKRFEYSRREIELLKIEDEQERSMELAEYQAEFVASLFDDKDVTKDLLLDGLDTKDANKIAEIIYYDVMAFPRPSKIGDDEKKES